MNQKLLLFCTLFLAVTSTAWAGDPVSYKEIAMLLRNGQDQRFIIQEIGRRKLMKALTAEEEQSLLSLRATPALMELLHDPVMIASAQDVDAYAARMQKQKTLARQDELDAERAARARLAAQQQKPPTPPQVDAAEAGANGFVGKAISLKFTASDGTPFDLANLRGKVVLIDFWASWCGPCMQEVPHVVSAYNKFHDKNFEIVGISLDNDKNAMLRTAAQKGMKWTQYCDGLGWKNAISSALGIRSIPAMWLVDKKGVLVSIDARENLEAKIASLLAR